LFAALVLVSCSAEELPDHIDARIGSIISEYVPDKREGVAEIECTIYGKNQILLSGYTDNQDLKGELLGFIHDSGYDTFDSLILLPDLSLTDKIWGLINVSVANMKALPSHSSELVSQAVMGTPVKILRRKGSWFYVQTPDHYLGWINNSGIHELTEDGLDKWKKADRVIFLRKTGEISGEGLTGSVVSDIVSGSIVELDNEAAAYYNIRLPDGRKGSLKKSESVVFSDWTGITKTDISGLIQFAHTMNGHPYLWGGTSAKALDCSGFMKTIWFMQGIILARDASQQFLYGSPVSFTDSYDVLEPGDMLFFGSVNSDGTRRIIHVGLYIGDTEVIHSSGRVMVSSLDSLRSNFSPYLRNTYQGARRYIGNEGKKGIEKIIDNTWYNSR